MRWGARADVPLATGAPLGDARGAGSRRRVVHHEERVKVARSAEQERALPENPAAVLVVL